MKQILILIMLSFTAFANAQTENLSGTVTDENGELVMFATVKLKKSGSLIKVTQTDFDGNYQFDSLSVGMYDLQVSHVGCATKSVSNVLIFSNETVVLNVEISQDEGTFCTLHYTIPLIEHDNTTQGATFTAKEIRRMPIKN